MPCNLGLELRNLNPEALKFPFGSHRGTCSGGPDSRHNCFACFSNDVCAFPFATANVAVFSILVATILEFEPRLGFWEDVVVQWKVWQHASAEKQVAE